MTDHLPECDWKTVHDYCICRELCACEQRVRSEAFGELVQANKAWDRGWDRGHFVGLDEAEAAVVTYANDTHKHKGDLFGMCMVDYGDRCDITAALTQAAAAIRALKEKP